MLCNLAGVVLLVSLTTASDLILIQGSENELHVNARTRDLVVPVGATVDLTCKTNEPWNLCGWQQPNELYCNHLSTAVYDTGCANNDRIKFSRGSSQDPSQHETTCSISVIDVNLEDSGTWTCVLKEEVHDSSSAKAEIQVDVAAPYALDLQPEDPTKVVNAPENSETNMVGTNVTSPNPTRQSDEEIICIATGGGARDPVLEWYINGERVESHLTNRWEEDHSDGMKRIFLALPLDPSISSNFELLDPLEEEQVVHLRCVSKQLYPNGTIIFESSKATDLRILNGALGPQAYEQSDEVSEAGSNTAGNVIAGLLIFAVVCFMIFLCYAQKFKKFCYAPGKRVYKPVDVNNEDEEGSPNSRTNRQNSVPDPEITFESIEVTLEPISEVRASQPNQEEQPQAEEQQQQNQRPQSIANRPPQPLPPLEIQRARNSSVDSTSSRPSWMPPETPVSPPPSAPPCSPPKDHFGSQARLEELIAAAPLSLPNPEEKDKGNIIKKLKAPTGARAMSVPEPKGLSDALVTPRGNQVKRHNDYVKSRPRTLQPEVEPESPVAPNPARPQSDQVQRNSRGPQVQPLQLPAQPPPPIPSLDLSPQPMMTDLDGIDFADENGAELDRSLDLPQPPDAAVDTRPPPPSETAL